MAFVRAHAAALALCAVLLLGGLATLFPAPPARAGIAVVLTEDFESGTFGARWNATDNNAAGGLDYWGISGARTHTGNYSAWCAEVGRQSDTGLNNTGVQQYDDNMQADLIVNLSVNGFTSLTLSFYYWSKTENGGGDYIEAWYVAGGVYTQIFQNRGTANWALASTAVPNNVETLVIRFTTDGANHGFEGAYVDDIVLTGTENVAPTSNVLALPTFTNRVPHPIAYTAQDNPNASGVAYVELWWRIGGSGNFTLYVRPSNPLGRWNPWVSPTIPFDRAFAGGDGLYEFYTVAVDNATNAEAPPAAADASMTVDTVAPTIAITAPAANATVNSNSITFDWNGTDATSGIDHFEVWLDGGAPTSTTNPTVTIAGIADGAHTFHVAAIDRAGNRNETSVLFVVNGNPYGWIWWLVLIVIAIAGIVLFLIWWKRRKDEEAERPAEGEGTDSEPAAEPETEPEGAGDTQGDNEESPAESDEPR